jgi:hypothetical protein
MRELRHSKVRTILLLALVGSGGFLFGTRAIQAQGLEGMEVLTRGPVHEAFADLAGSGAETGLVIQKAPPAAIEEIPPEERPEGDEFAWIPGYWGWDEERNDFLWISGVWRVPPPDCNWTPGYWTQIEGGFQWVPGYWLPNSVEETFYLPPPPASLEEGPQSDPPSPDHIWVPGNWVWPEDRYVWQPGYWVQGSPDWVYTPTHYNWTPRGYVCVNGYWDYPIANRGMLFAPVYFSQPVYARPDFRYSPNVYIESGGLTNNLFRYPRYNHYVFGDYYGDESLHLGIVPWFQLDFGHHDYDPNYSHRRWERGRHDSRWSDQMQDDYRNRKEKVDTRPPRIFVDPRASSVSHPDGIRNNAVFAKPLQEVSKEKNPPHKLKKIDQGERDNLGKKGRDLRKFTEERAQRERVQARQIEAARANDQAAKIEKLAIPKSPIKSAQRPAKDGVKAPPALPQLPKPDLNAQPGERKGKGPNRETPKNEVLKKIGVPHDPLPVIQPKPNEANPNSIQGAPKADGAGTESKDRNPRGNLKQRNPQAPPPKAEVNPNQTVPKTKPKGKQGAKLQALPAPPPVTDPPPAQNQDAKGKGKGKDNSKGKDKK